MSSVGEWLTEHGVSYMTHPDEGAIYKKGRYFVRQCTNRWQVCKLSAKDVGVYRPVGSYSTRGEALERLVRL